MIYLTGCVGALLLGLGVWIGVIIGQRNVYKRGMDEDVVAHAENPWTGETGA